MTSTSTSEAVAESKPEHSTDLLFGGASESNTNSLDKERTDSNTTTPNVTVSKTSRIGTVEDGDSDDSLSDHSEFISHSRTDVNCTLAQSDSDNTESRVPPINNKTIDEQQSRRFSPSKNYPDVKLNKGFRKKEHHGGTQPTAPHKARRGRVHGNL